MIILFSFWGSFSSIDSNSIDQTMQKAQSKYVSIIAAVIYGFSLIYWCYSGIIPVILLIIAEALVFVSIYVVSAEDSYRT